MFACDIKQGYRPRDPAILASVCFPEKCLHGFTVTCHDIVRSGGDGRLGVTHGGVDGETKADAQYVLTWGHQQHQTQCVQNNMGDLKTMVSNRNEEQYHICQLKTHVLMACVQGNMPTWGHVFNTCLL